MNKQAPVWSLVEWEIREGDADAFGQNEGNRASQ
jgi:hypothetical protein